MPGPVQTHSPIPIPETGIQSDRTYCVACVWPQNTAGEGVRTYVQVVATYVRVVTSYVQVVATYVRVVSSYVQVVMTYVRVVTTYARVVTSYVQVVAIGVIGDSSSEFFNPRFQSRDLRKRR